MFSHTYDTCPLVVCDHEYCYFLPRFGLLHNTTHWGKIEGTRSLVLCLFSYSKHANGRIVFQVLLPFSPVRGELPVFLVVMGSVYVNSEMLCINPVLNLFKYRLYEITIEHSAETFALITRRQRRLKHGDVIRVVDVGRGILLEKRV